jgi:hypothetical protein
LQIGSRRRETKRPTEKREELAEDHERCLDRVRMFFVLGPAHPVPRS